uniref:Uncharacterized protein n=1 Tax=Solanum lycopersicum TaxID=4081 RepID=A0A3Q7IM06_SOLLC
MKVRDEYEEEITWVKLSTMAKNGHFFFLIRSLKGPSEEVKQLSIEQSANRWVACHPLKEQALSLHWHSHLVGTDAFQGKTFLLKGACWELDGDDGTSSSLGYEYLVISAPYPDKQMKRGWYKRHSILDRSSGTRYAGSRCNLPSRSCMKFLIGRRVDNLYMVSEQACRHWMTFLHRENGTTSASPRERMNREDCALGSFSPRKKEHKEESRSAGHRLKNSIHLTTAQMVGLTTLEPLQFKPKTYLIFVRFELYVPKLVENAPLGLRQWKFR